MEKPLTMSREQRCQAVWTTPVVQLAKRFGLSDVGLARVCIRHQVPRPGLGYWGKKQHGKVEPRPKLPRLDDPKVQTISLAERPESDVPDGPKRCAQDDEVIAEPEAPALSVTDGRWAIAVMRPQCSRVARPERQAERLDAPRQRHSEPPESR